MCIIHQMSRAEQEGLAKKVETLSAQNQSLHVRYKDDLQRLVTQFQYCSCNKIIIIRASLSMHIHTQHTQSEDCLGRSRPRQT